MSISDGKYHLFSTSDNFRLAWHEGDSVKVDNKSPVLVEVKSIPGGYQMRYDNHGTKSAWFGASDDISDDNRVLLKGDPDFVWYITSADSRRYKIGIPNRGEVWYLRDGFTNGSSVQLGPAQGCSNELWYFWPDRMG